VIGVNLFGTRSGRTRNALQIGLAALEHLLRRSGGSLETADVLITPELSGLSSYMRFGGRAAAAGLGAQATEAQLPAMRAALCPEPA
jgi:hypothetical protein